MIELCASERYDKEEFRKTIKKVPENFDEHCNFLTCLIFNRCTSVHQELDGRLWIREIFMAAQTNTIKQPGILIKIFAFLLSSSYLLGRLICDVILEDRNPSDKPVVFWIYNSLLIVLNIFHNNANFKFLWLGCLDAKRRNYIM